MRSLSIVLLALCLAAVSAVPEKHQKIVGGSVTTIEQYPFATPLLYSSNSVTYWQTCGGTIINNRAILTAAQCLYRSTADRWRIRVGSTWANSGGAIHNSAQIIVHPNHNFRNFDNDVAVLRSASTFTFSNSVQAASISGTNYNLGDNEVVWAIGWGANSTTGSFSEQLRHVQIWTVNQATCRNNYDDLGMSVTNNMLCAGWLGVGGRDQCLGDDGGPLIHNNVIVGVSSWGYQCAIARFPGIYTRISRYTSWIQSNA